MEPDPKATAASLHGKEARRLRTAKDRQPPVPTARSHKPAAMADLPDAAVSPPSAAKIKAAVVHASPVYMDKQATTAKVVRLIQEAGEKGVELLAFPETFIPGYPVSRRFPDTARRRPRSRS